MKRSHRVSRLKRSDTDPIKHLLRHVHTPGIESFLAPSPDNGIIKDLLVPVQLVGDLVHDGHHVQLPNGQNGPRPVQDSIGKPVLRSVIHGQAKARELGLFCFHSRGLDGVTVVSDSLESGERGWSGRRRDVGWRIWLLNQSVIGKVLPRHTPAAACLVVSTLFLVCRFFFTCRLPWQRYMYAMRVAQLLSFQTVIQKTAIILSVLQSIILIGNDDIPGCLELRSLFCAALGTTRSATCHGNTSKY